MSTKAPINQKKTPNSPVKEGKKSIKDIHSQLGFAPIEELGQNGLSDMDLDGDLKKELQEYDLVPRFINFRRYKELGFHKRGWVPYKRESQPKNTVLFNLDANGYTVRGDLVLAVKPRDYNEHRKKQLMAANGNKEGIIKRKSQEFQELARSKGINATVDDSED